MPSTDIAMVAAETTRSRAYLQILLQNDIVPSCILILQNDTEEMLPGQLDPSADGLSISERAEEDSIWEKARFDPNETIYETLDRYGLRYAPAVSRDVNDPEVVEQIRGRPEKTFIYSGYGGVILRKELMGLKKNFLHVHGGYLPDYKGSTTCYYSLLQENSIGASSIFLTDTIDSGPVLHRRTFPPPPDRENIDHLYDSMARALVLVETVRRYLAGNRWVFELANNEGGDTHYIIHPLLKHIAIRAENPVV